MGCSGGCEQIENSVIAHQSIDRFDIHTHKLCDCVCRRVIRTIWRTIRRACPSIIGEKGLSEQGFDDRHFRLIEENGISPRRIGYIVGGEGLRSFLDVNPLGEQFIDQIHDG